MIEAIVILIEQALLQFYIANQKQIIADLRQWQVDMGWVDTRWN